MAEYIDRDKIISAIIRWEDKPYFSYYAVLRDVMNLSPADVVECKHGKWIWDDEGYHCSECFFHAYGNTGEILSGDYHFCPNCGADMRGGKDD